MSSFKARLGQCGLVTWLLSASAFADWPQTRGPNHDGSVEASIEPSWQAETPRVVWRTPLNSGFSSLVLAGETISTLVLREVDGAPMEMCLALDRRTGAELWATVVGPAKYTGVGYDSGNYGAPGNQGGDGPRSTPAMDGARVFAMSSRLRLHCMDAETGAILWKRDLVGEFNGTQITYENAASPVLDGERLLVAGGGPGESILCFAKSTGRVLWKKHNEQLTHSTPLLTTIQGRRQAIFFTRTGLLSIDPITGNALWHYKFPFRVCAAITPVVGGNMVYCSAGYGIGSGLCKIFEADGQFSVREVWRQRRNEPVANYWSTPIHDRGHLYGMFGFKKFHTAPFKCVELTTGVVKWEKPGFGHGSVIRVGEWLLALTGYGEIVLIRPNPDAYEELGRFKALSGKCWSTPAFSEGKLYLRSTTEGACLELPSRETSGKLAISPKKRLIEDTKETAAD